MKFESAQHPHRQVWDSRYRESYRPRPPSALLQRWLPRFHPTPGHDRALDLACGAGRNLLLLAAHGWHAIGVDLSPVALHLARDVTRQRGLVLDLLAIDLHTWSFPQAYFDLVCVFRFLDRSLCPRMTAALRPGGVLIYETFTVEQRNYEGGPRSDDMLLQPGELATLFPTLNVLEYNEGVVEEDGRPRALASLVGVLGSA